MTEKPLFETLDLTSARNVWVVGDVHGHFTLLEERLLELGFSSKAGDHLLSVGDLVDRGPESEVAFDVVDLPWFHAVRGNHEEMCTPEYAGSNWHVQNGGGWVLEVPSENRLELLKKLTDLPVAMEVLLPDGRKVGLCHASLPACKFKDEMVLTDWADVPQLLSETKHMRDNPFLWDRSQVSRAMKLARHSEELRSERKLREFNPPNVDHVFFGHTPMKEPLTLGKCTWLDTGAFATGVLTVVEA